MKFEWPWYEAVEWPQAKILILYDVCGLDFFDTVAVCLSLNILQLVELLSLLRRGLYSSELTAKEDVININLSDRRAMITR